MTQPHKDVHLTDDNGHVDQNDVPVSKKLGEEVTWYAYDHQFGATIEFSSADGSPFYDATFYVPIGGSVSTGPAKNVDPKRYKYTVNGHGGQNDPGVIIQN